MYCYLLESVDKRRTYIGATVDVDRRLDQHNGKLAGGAKATKGRAWKRILYVGGFPSWEDTLSFEWAWKYHSPRKGVEGRIAGLMALLAMEQCTSQATPFRLWSHNFFVRTATDVLPELKKIETWRMLASKLRVNIDNNPFPTFQLPTFLSKMSSSTVSVEMIQQLQASVDAMRADVMTLNTRLAEALKTQVPAAEGVAEGAAEGAKKVKKVKKTKAAAETTEAAPAAEGAAEPKKRGRKPKAAAEQAPVAEEAAPEAADAADEKKPRKKREPKPKAVCPTATEGVVRFAGSSDDNKYKVFNNLYRKAFTVEGKEYPSVQHYLVYQKFATTDPEYAAKALEQKNPALLSGMLKSKEHASRADWETAQYTLMETALKAKFADAELQTLLKETGTAKIEFESATDGVLGIGADGNGQNKLGVSLMAIRSA
jgi:ribA/ribD-fused uncharacterized protein